MMRICSACHHCYSDERDACPTCGTPRTATEKKKRDEQFTSTVKRQTAKANELAKLRAAALAEYRS
jgi:uncharacterized OB-fold protein